MDEFHFLTFRQKYERMKELAGKLHASQAQLREVNESLDERVRLRTEELETAQGDLLEKQESLNESREQLRALVAKLRRVQEQERVGMARDIHDELGQLLTGLKMDVRWLEDRLSAPDPPTELNPLIDRAVEASELVDQTIETVQNLAAKLRPSALDHLGLVDAVKNYAREFHHRFEIPVVLMLEDPEIEIIGKVGNELFFICQEALTNVVRHAEARSVEIRIAQEGHEIVLEVRDDGIGFKPSLLQSPKSLGLIGMEERALQIGGTLEIEPQSAGGTCVRVRAPMPETAAADKSCTSDTPSSS
jgi:signal transduction histidine kinase